jgi:hypothetical protein
MPIAQSPGFEGHRQPYMSLREHPRYEEIKRIIEAFPPENIDCLKIYISKWLADCNGTQFTRHLTQ